MADLSSLLLHGPLDAATLTARLGISQATLSRLISADPQVLKYGRARATRYALLRPLREESRFPLWQIDEQGVASKAGQLYSVWPAGSCVVEDRHQNLRYFDGLPWYLNDMRPQGFLGRAWGRECAIELALPEDIRQWNDDHCLIALTARGSDVSGNLLIGQQSYQRWLRQPALVPIAPEQKQDLYPEMAKRVLAGEEVGSSAGGEQPKFVCYAAQDDNSQAQVLVKFTPERRNENSQRWCDLLRAEALALHMLQQEGLHAADASILTGQQGQLFLEVVRFDRIGQSGRKSLVSLESVQGEFTGSHARWPQALSELLSQKKITAEDAARGTLQWAFGRLIANGDMHGGNLSFFLTSPTLTLTPTYDMLPMSFAPNSAGYMRDRPPVIELDSTIGREVWQRALSMAQRYWQAIAEGEAWSDDFRRLAREMGQALQELAPQIERMA
ncbi:transcriptional regulator [Erwinia typographi]|uniref:Transcriptional regulator n=1 Tax=Erwinia typographi TaxID=371042 RepID=A0A0A3ZS31_9GAMM|nr:type II toxin-antitoxin system HipA family toxin YjjJ [Erwinia typographi]KGT88463.1 transcriptional regulator [Erwinia typographi]